MDMLTLDKFLRKETQSEKSIKLAGAFIHMKNCRSLNAEKILFV